MRRAISFVIIAAVLAGSAFLLNRYLRSYAANTSPFHSKSPVEAAERQVSLLLQYSRAANTSEKVRVVQREWAKLTAESVPAMETALGRGDLNADQRTLLVETRDALQLNERRVKAMRSTVDWYERTYIKTFEKQAIKESESLGSGRSAVTSAMRIASGDPDATGNEFNELIGSLWIMGGRCTEPLIAYLNACEQSRINADRGAVADLFRNAVKGLRGSPYHPLIQCEALLRTASAIATLQPASTPKVAPRDRWNPLAVAETDALIEEAKARLKEAAATPLPRRAILQLFDLIWAVSQDVFRDHETLHTRMVEVLASSATDRSTLLTLQGWHQCYLAWDARGNGWPSEAPAGGLARFRKTLPLAGPLFEEAFKLDASNADAAVGMMTVAQGVGNGAANTDSWFRKAVEANTTPLRSAYEKQLEVLEPKWGGSAEQVIAFGRQSVARHDWKSAAPLTLITAHLNLSRYANRHSGSWRDPYQRAYFKGNAQAWDDIQSVLPKYLSYHPQDTQQKCRYAQLACWCEQWAAAAQAFKELEGAEDFRVFSRDEQAGLRHEVELHSAMLASAGSTRASTQPLVDYTNYPLAGLKPLATPHLTPEAVERDWPLFKHEPYRSRVAALPLPFRVEGAGMDASFGYGWAFLMAEDFVASLPDTPPHLYPIYREHRQAVQAWSPDADADRVAALLGDTDATHGVSGTLTVTADGWQGSLTVFDRDGKPLLIRKYDKPRPWHELLGDMEVDALAKLAATTSSELVGLLHQPRCRKLKSVSQLGATALLPAASDEESAAYRHILADDPEFSEVRVWAAHEKWVRDGKRAPYELQRAIAVHSRFTPARRVTRSRCCVPMRTLLRFIRNGSLGLKRSVARICRDWRTPAWPALCAVTRCRQRSPTGRWPQPASTRLRRHCCWPWPRDLMP